MGQVKDHRPAMTPEDLLERLRSHGQVDLAESVAEAVAMEREDREAALIPPAVEPRKPGHLKGQIHMADDFDAPLPDEVVKAFLGET